MQYPLTLSFKIIALAPQIYIRDAQGQELLYVKQKLLKLKEKIHVFSDSGQSRELYELGADRILDFSPRFTFRDTAGRMVGAVKRQGARSLLKASYEIFGPDDRPVARIEEENAWVKLLDAVIGEIPVIGAFTGYFLNPKYLVVDLTSQRPMLRVTKHRSFLESRFEIERLESTLGETSETAALLAILVMVLLERERG
jgi:uncharacterized protein YxjI